MSKCIFNNYIYMILFLQGTTFEWLYINLDYNQTKI